MSLKERVTKEIEHKKKHLDKAVESINPFGLPNDEDSMRPNARFKTYDDLFQNLTTSKRVRTFFPLVSCTISYNSKSAIAVTQKSEGEYIVKQYCLKTGEMTFMENLGESDKGYLKFKEIE